MRSLIRTCFLLIIILSAISCDKRKRIVILESGVNVTEKLKPFLCNGGHKSFLEGRTWSKDETGHGTNIVEVLSQKLDNQKNFFVIGSSERRFNYGEIIKEKRNPNHKDQSGARISAARFACELMAQD